MRESKEQHNLTVENGLNGADTLRNRVKEVYHISRLISILSEPLSCLTMDSPKNNESYLNEGIGMLVKVINYKQFIGVLDVERAEKLTKYFTSIQNGISIIQELQYHINERAEEGKPLPPHLQVIEDRIYNDLKTPGPIH